MATLTIDGKRKFIYGSSELEVVQKMREKKKSVTMEDFLYQWYGRVVQQLAPKTQSSYEGIIRLHLIPHIGHHELVKLRPEHLYALIEQLQKKNLSTRTVHYVLSVLSRALNWAVRWEYVEKNVVALIKLPGYAYPEIEPLTVSQARELLNAVRGHRLESLYRLALSLGMRQGELIRLTWNDVDVQQRTIFVRQSKTRAGRRKIELPDTLFETLNKHKEHIENERVYAHHWTDHGLVFPSEVGTPLAARNIFRHFKALLIKVGLPKTIRFHDLRHSCAAFLIAEGVDLHIVKQLLGHSKISITSDFYGHLLPGVGGSALGKVDDLLR